MEESNSSLFFMLMYHIYKHVYKIQWGKKEGQAQQQPPANVIDRVAQSLLSPSTAAAVKKEARMQQERTTTVHSIVCVIIIILSEL